MGGSLPATEGNQDSSGVRLQFKPNISLEDRKEGNEHLHTLESEQKEAVGCVSQQDRLKNKQKDWGSSDQGTGHRGVPQRSSHEWDVSSFHLPVDELHGLETAQSVSSSLPDRVTFGPTSQGSKTIHVPPSPLPDQVTIGSLIRRSPLEHYKSRRRANTFELDRRKLDSIKENSTECNSDAFNPPLRASEDTLPSSTPPASLTEDTSVRVLQGDSKRKNKRGCKKKSQRSKRFVAYMAESITFLRVHNHSYSSTGKEDFFPRPARFNPAVQRWDVDSHFLPVDELQDLEAAQACSSTLLNRVTLKPTPPIRRSPFDHY